MLKTIINTSTLPRDRRFKAWSKIVEHVDKSKTNGFSFIGSFLEKGLNEVEQGTYVLHYHEEGSAKYHYPNAELYIVTADDLELLEDFGELESQWALEIRDRVAEIIDAPQAGPTAEDIAAAVALLEAAGYTVTAPEANE